MRVEPSGFRYDYWPHGRANASVTLLPGLFAGEWLWESVSTLLREEGFGVLRVVDPLAVFDWQVGGIEAVRAALRAVLDETSVGRSTLCGNSLGGLVALDFARHHPDRVESLVVSGAPGLQHETELGLGRPRRVTREVLVRLGEALFHDPARVTEEMIQRTAEVLSERRHFGNVLRALKATREYRVEEVLLEVRCRVLLLWGQNDRVTPATPWEPWARALENFELRTVPQCGHSPMVERPDAFNELLLDFLRRQRQAP